MSVGVMAFLMATISFLMADILWRILNPYGDNRTSYGEYRTSMAKITSRYGENYSGMAKIIWGRSRMAETTFKERRLVGWSIMATAAFLLRLLLRSA